MGAVKKNDTHRSAHVPKYKKKYDDTTRIFILVFPQWKTFGCETFDSNGELRREIFRWDKDDMKKYFRCDVCNWKYENVYCFFFLSYANARFFVYERKTLNNTVCIKYI